MEVLTIWGCLYWGWGIWHRLKWFPTEVEIDKSYIFWISCLWYYVGSPFEGPNKLLYKSTRFDSSKTCEMYNMLLVDAYKDVSTFTVQPLSYDANGLVRLWRDWEEICQVLITWMEENNFPNYTYEVEVHKLICYYIRACRQPTFIRTQRLAILLCTFVKLGKSYFHVRLVHTVEYDHSAY